MAQSLQAGDSITIAVTHQVSIRGEDAWIKIEIQSKVQEDEIAETALARINHQVQGNIIEIIESTAKTVMDYEDRRRA